MIKYVGTHPLPASPGRVLLHRRDRFPPVRSGRPARLRHAQVMAASSTSAIPHGSAMTGRRSDTSGPIPWRPARSRGRGAVLLHRRPALPHGGAGPFAADGPQGRRVLVPRPATARRCAALMDQRGSRHQGVCPPPVNVSAAPPGYHVVQVSGGAPPAIPAGSRASAASAGTVRGSTGAGGSAGTKAPRPGVRGVKLAAPRSATAGVSQ